MQEVTISIPDEAYATATRRAEQEGFGSAETYLSDFIVSNIAGTPDNYDHLFTPAVIAELDAAVEEARSGNNISLDEVRRRFKMKRQVWDENHPA